jgi:simple sugar transport system permease protein
MAPGFGWSGIAVAVLAGFDPLWVAVVGTVLGGVLVGTDGMSRTLGVPASIADVMVPAALLSMLAASALARYRVVWRGHEQPVVAV